MRFSWSSFFGLILFVVYTSILSSCDISNNSVDDEDDIRQDSLIKNSRKHHFIRLSNDGEIRWMVAYDVENKIDVGYPFDIIIKDSTHIQIMYPFQGSNISLAEFEIREDTILFQNSSNYKLKDYDNYYYRFGNFNSRYGLIMNNYGKVTIDGFQSTETYYISLFLFKFLVKNSQVENQRLYWLNPANLSKNRYRTFYIWSYIGGNTPRFLINETTYDVLFDSVYNSLTLNPIFKTYKIGYFDNDSTINYLYDVPKDRENIKYITANDRFGLYKDANNYYLTDNYEPITNLGNDYLSASSKQVLFSDKIVDLEKGNISSLSKSMEVSFWKNSLISNNEQSWLLRIFTPNTLAIDLIDNKTGFVKKSEEYSNPVVFRKKTNWASDILKFEMNGYTYVYID